MNSIEGYLEILNDNSFNEFDLEMKKYAKEYEVPIIKDEGLAFLKQIIAIKKPIKILEIGSAIGYSAIQMTKGNNSLVTTIERDNQLFNIAKKNIKEAGLSQRIEIINVDGLEYNFAHKYDLVFIDGAKAQYKNFFLKIIPHLNEEAIIITDNLLFHGLVTNDYIESRNLRQLVGKIKSFTKWLVSREDFQTNIYAIGDGISVSIKKRP